MADLTFTAGLDTRDFDRGARRLGTGAERLAGVYQRQFGSMARRIIGVAGAYRLLHSAFESAGRRYQEDRAAISALSASYQDLVASIGHAALSLVTVSERARRARDAFAERERREAEVAAWKRGLEARIEAEEMISTLREERLRDEGRMEEAEAEARDRRLRQLRRRYLELKDAGAGPVADELEAAIRDLEGRGAPPAAGGAASARGAGEIGAATTLRQVVGGQAIYPTQAEVARNTAAVAQEASRQTRLLESIDRKIGHGAAYAP